MEKKIENTPEILCKDCPSKQFILILLVEFKQYLDYVRGLQFTEKPDYSYLKELFNKLMQKLEYVQDFVYDWSLQKGENVPNNRKSSYFVETKIEKNLIENLEKIKLS